MHLTFIYHNRKGKESIQIFVPIVCWGPKCDKEAHSMKSKEGTWTLTKEGSACEVKKDHGGPKAQKEGKWKKNVKKKEDPNLGHKWVLHPLGSGSFKRWLENREKDVDNLEDLKKDVDNLEDAKKDVNDLEGSLGTSHSHLSLKEGKEGKIHWLSCQNQVSGKQREVKGTSGDLKVRTWWRNQRTSVRAEEQGRLGIIFLTYGPSQ